MQISVFEILSSPNAMFHQDGLKLHESMLEAFGKGEKVVINFKNVQVLTTQFLNASFGKLMVEKGISFFMSKVTITGADHLTSFQTKLDWVVDNIKNDSNYRPMLDAALA